MTTGFWPGDQCHGFALSMIEEDVSKLRNDKMLVGRLLDYLLQRGLFPSTIGAVSEDDSVFNICCGSTSWAESMI